MINRLFELKQFTRRKSALCCLLSLFLFTGCGSLQAKNDVVSLSQSKMSVLLFVSTQCPCSDSHLERAVSLLQTFKKIDLYAVYVDQKKNISDLEKYHLLRAPKISTVIDQDHKLVHLHQITTTPEVVVLNEAGDVMYKGAFTDSPISEDATVDYLSDSIEKIMAGKAILAKYIKPVGCPIR